LRTLNQPKVKLEILDRIGRLRPDLERRWGKMNARQMVCHLNDSFFSAMGGRQLTTNPDFRFSGLVKWCALYLPAHWPHDVLTVPELDQELGGTPPGDFDEDRQMLAGLVEQFTQQPRGFNFQPHPMFVELTEWQWMRWGWLHTDHHLRQFGV
jgi:hypothetical protein